MPDPIFCRTRHVYSSYVDFWHLVELSGFPCIYVDQIDPHSDNVYIFTPLNGENQDGWNNPKAQIILWDLEWRLDLNNGADGVGVSVPGVERIWASDAWYAEAIGAEYVPLGSHPGLAEGYTENSNGKTFDAAVMAYLGPYRRNNMVNRLRDAGVVIAPNGWAQERHDILRASRSMLHIHQHDGIQTVAPQRWALTAAYELPLISETVIDGGIFGYDHMLLTDYANMERFVPMWVRRNETQVLEDYGRALYQLLCVERTFRKCVEAAL